MNLVLPKRRVLEIYLNIAEWGPNGEFGAEAAARWAFGKSARDLPREAAELAAILPNPVRRSARSPASWCAGSPAFTSAAPPPIRGSTPAFAPAQPASGIGGSHNFGVPIAL